MKTVNRHHSLTSGGRVPLIAMLFLCFGSPVHAQSVEPDLVKDRSDSPARIEEAMPIEAHRETPRDPWMPRASTSLGTETGHSGAWSRGSFESVQVNVDAKGNNIFGDAANEPSIAVDPTDPNRIVIGWRQFDNVSSNFRQAGWAYSHDGGATWTFPGVLEPGVFRSDPVLGADADGNIHYYSLTTEGGFSYSCDLFTSTDGGVTWNEKVFGFGGDKAWMTIDQTDGPGRNNIYAFWSASFSCCGGQFTRSVDGGQSFGDPQWLPGGPRWGTLDVGPSGELYVLGTQLEVIRSDDAMLETTMPTFTTLGVVDLCRCSGCTASGSISPNPGGLLGQAWIAVDRSNTATRGNVYALHSLCRDDDPRDVMFARSIDGGRTWSRAVRVNDDPNDTNAWQWFGTMSVAPHGRIDAIWNDTRNTGVGNLSELFYAFSPDGGITWSANVALSPVFDSRVGWPNQSKIGDYYDMVSSDRGPSIAYAATFNEEQDVYFLRFDLDCDGNGIADADETAAGSAEDCNGNFVPDVCEPDLDRDGLVNSCDSDIDNDGIPNERDVCLFAPLDGPSHDDGRPFSDTNGNCEVDFTDYARFRNCLAAGGPDVDAPPETCLSVFDYNDDGHVDLRDAAGFSTAFTGDP